MNDPVRLQKSGSAGAKALLAVGRRDLPSDLAQHILLGALGVIAPPPPPASHWHFLKHSAWLKVGVTAMVSGLVVHAIDTRTPTTLPTTEIAHLQAVPAPVAQPLAARPLATKRPAPLAKRRDPAPRTSLAQELAAIVSVREALDNNDSAAALRALDAHERTYGKGAFAEEALALRVRALRLEGDDTAAERTLDTLRLEFPESVHISALAH